MHTMLNMLEKQASQVKTVADQFRALMTEIDKVAYTPFKNSPVAGADKLFAVRDYESSTYRNQYGEPGGTDEVLARPPLPTVAETTHNPSEAEAPPKPAQDGDDTRMQAQARKREGEVGYTWDPSKEKVHPIPELVSMEAPGIGRGSSEPQPRTTEKTGSRRSFEQTISKLASQGRIRTLAGWR